MGETTLINMDFGGTIIIYSDYKEASATRRTWVKAEAVEYYKQMSVKTVMDAEDRLAVIQDS